MALSWSTTSRCTPSAVPTGMTPSGATLQNSYISVSPRDGCTSPTRPRQPYMLFSFVPERYRQTTNRYLRSQGPLAATVTTRQHAVAEGLRCAVYCPHSADHT